MVAAGSGEDLLRIFFAGDTKRHAQADRAAVPIFAVVKDDRRFLRPWYEHYKTHGAGPFFIVDDQSNPPVAATLNEADVAVFRPSVGFFKGSKTGWVAALIKAFAAEGQWVLTVDADEFIDIPARLAPSWPELAARCSALDLHYLPGLMIDLVPPDPEGAAQRLAEGAAFIDLFSHHSWDKNGSPDDYPDKPPIAWAFGKHWRTSYRLDLRYRVFGTIDVLRKVPFFRVRPDLSLNHGFHDLKTPDRRRGIPASLLWAGKDLLPVRHYKLVKLFEESGRNDIAAKTSTDGVYHGRTTENLRRQIAMDGPDLHRRLRTLALKRYSPDTAFAAGREPWLDRIGRNALARARGFSSRG
jgi:hypothetical protein